MLALRLPVFVQAVDFDGNVLDAGALSPNVRVRHISETIDGVTYFQALAPVEGAEWVTVRAFPLAKSSLTVVRD